MSGIGRRIRRITVNCGHSRVSFSFSSADIQRLIIVIARPVHALRPCTGGSVQARHREEQRDEETRDAVRRLRSADPSFTLERIEAFTLASLIPPDVATDINKVFRKVWEETPMESPTA
jgi:hypothetical protein